MDLNIYNVIKLNIFNKNNIKTIKINLYGIDAVTLDIISNIETTEKFESFNLNTNNAITIDEIKDEEYQLLIEKLQGKLVELLPAVLKN
ncbi:MAG: hypothetical protein ACK5HL_00260 [Bacilli bacterium]